MAKKTVGKKPAEQAIVTITKPTVAEKPEKAGKEKKAVNEPRRMQEKDSIKLESKMPLSWRRQRQQTKVS